MTEEQEATLLGKVNDIHEVVLGDPKHPEQSLIMKVSGNTEFRLFFKKVWSKVIFGVIGVMVALSTKDVWATFFK